MMKRFPFQYELPADCPTVARQWPRLTTRGRPKTDKSFPSGEISN